MKYAIYENDQDSLKISTKRKLSGILRETSCPKELLDIDFGPDVDIVLYYGKNPNDYLTLKNTINKNIYEVVLKKSLDKVEKALFYSNFR